MDALFYYLFYVIVSGIFVHKICILLFSRRVYDADQLLAAKVSRVYALRRPSATTKGEK
jgi:hypothetical protein